MPETGKKYWSGLLPPHVRAIFEQPIHTDFGYYVLEGQGPRSLGTVCPQSIAKVGYDPSQEEPGITACGLMIRKETPTG
jgi:hypothetical protein